MNHPVSSDLAAAIERHRAGDFQEAERIYRARLAASPDDPEVLHLLGLLEFDSGRTESGIARIGRAVELEPGNPAYLNSLGNASRATGYPQMALDLLRAALKIRPDYAEAYVGIGMAQDTSGAYEDAADSFRQAIALRPKLGLAHHNLAETLLKCGRHAEACVSARHACELMPSSGRAHLILGTALHHLGRLAEAEQALRMAVELEHDTVAFQELATVLRESAKLEEAESAASRAVAAAPRDWRAHYRLALIHYERGRFAQAEACNKAALDSNPHAVPALIAMSAALFQQDRLDEAATACERALAIQPSDAVAHRNLGAIALERGHLDEAEAHSRQSMDLDAREAAWLHGMVLLLRGNFAAGLPLYERRFESLAYRRGSKESINVLEALAATPRWRLGEKLQGKRLLLWAEQGMGDTIMMARYFRLLRDAGASRLVVLCPPSLRRLLEAAREADVIESNTAALEREPVDLHCPLMSLPYLSGTTLNSIPARIPYLAVPPCVAAEWGRRLAPFPGVKVGLAWAGSETNGKDRWRTLKLDQLASLALPGSSLFSLQKGPAARQVQDAGVRVTDLMDDCADWLDTAGLISGLDLVVSVDTAVAHLAGALGKPVWLLNRFASEWRWMTDVDRSPWYPSMRIFRQHKRGDWAGVVQRAAAELARMTAGDPR